MFQKKNTMVIIFAESPVKSPKTAQKTYQTVWFKWIFELRKFRKFDLKEFSYEKSKWNFDGTNELVRSPVIFTVFWGFLIAEQIFFSLQVKRTLINSNKLYIRVASWVAQRLKT